MRGRKWWTYTAALGAAIFCMWGIREIHPFLAINRPVHAEILVIEGWVPSTYIPLAAQEFQRGNYQHIVVVGGSIQPDVNGSQNRNSERATRVLIQFGIDKTRITMVYAPSASYHKTWTYAQAFRDWLLSAGKPIQTVNVFTVDVHARKSLLLFQRALGPTVKVGVISARHWDYDPAFWWLSPTGLYLVVKNAITYVDALLLTGPS